MVLAKLHATSANQQQATSANQLQATSTNKFQATLVMAQQISFCKRPSMTKLCFCHISFSPYTNSRLLRYYRYTSSRSLSCSCCLMYQ